MERYNEGELVFIKQGKRVLKDIKVVNKTILYQKIPALILKVIERNDQNPEWDKYLVMVEEQIDAVTSRCLYKF